MISTELEVVNGKLTGNLVGQNCRREQKVKRLEQVYGDLGQYHLRAWGDTRGDFELLQAAQDAHWRHFHKSTTAININRWLVETDFIISLLGK